MKKRMMALFLAIVFCITGMIAGKADVKAAEVEWDVDISTLLREDTLFGYLVNQTRGVYLAEGYSFINDGGGGRVGCGGVTNAAARCKVSVNANLEKKVSGSWVHVTSWSQINENALTASVSKYRLVPSGYYYRIRSVHTAGSDSSGSYTSALWM